MHDEQDKRSTEERLREVSIDPSEQRAFSVEDMARIREILSADDGKKEELQVLIPEVLPPKAEQAIEELQEEYEESVDAKRHELLRLRAGVLTGVLGRVQQGMDVAFKIPGARRTAEFVDLHTVENVMEFAMELVPFVGFWYAFTGYRLDIREHPETGDRILEREKISKLDRVLYGIGELLASGHIFRGVVKNIMKRSAKQVAKQLAQQAGKRAAENLTRRAKRGFERETGKVKERVIKKITG